MNNFWTIVKKEFKRFFTDKRLVASLIFPGIMLYAIYSIMGQIMPSTITGTVDSNYTFTIGYVNKSDHFSNLLGLSIANTKNQSIVSVDLLKDDVFTTEGSTLSLKKEYDTKISKEEINVIMYFDENFDSRVDEVKENPSTVEPPNSKIFYLSTNSASNTLKQYCSQIFSSSYYLPLAALNSSDSASETALATQIMSGILPMLVISLLFSSCMSVCPESIAGEKERGTISTLLVTPIKRSELAGGKIFSLSTFASIGAICSFLGVVFSLPSTLKLSGAESAVLLTPLQYFLMLLILVFTCILITSFMCILSTFSKTVKEANTYIGITMPFAMVFSLLTLFVSTTNIGVAFVPIYNSANCLAMLINGQYDAMFISMTILSNFIYSLICFFIVIKMFNSEKIMFSK